jgi:tetratricopeptide (TPR) repeat protein
VTLGEAQATRGDRRAIATLEKALAAPDLADDVRARGELAWGTALLGKKQTADAVVHLEKSATLAPKTERVWQLLGLAYDDTSAFDKAVAAYKRGLEALPKSATLAHELGMSLLQAGQNDEAVTYLGKASAIRGTDADILTDYAYALVLTGKHAEAKEQATLALGSAPDSADAYFNLGNAEAGLGNSKKARAALAKAVDLDELHVPALLHLALLEQAAGDDKNATNHFLRILQIEPDHARAKAGLGTSLAKIGSDDKRAKELLTRAVDVDPKYAQGQALLGDIAEREGDLDEAVKRYEKLQKLRPDDAATKARLEELRGKKKAAGPQKRK